MGIFSAKGEFITGLDDDDEFMPDRISSFVSAWDENIRSYVVIILISMQMEMRKDSNKEDIS